MNERLEAWFSGRVQGVGFRYRTAQIAAGRDLVGYVRNLKDGRVEVVVEGDPAEAREMIAEIERVMDGLVAEVEMRAADSRGEFTAFEIRH